MLVIAPSPAAILEFSFSWKTCLFGRIPGDFLKTDIFLYHSLRFICLCVCSLCVLPLQQSMINISNVIPVPGLFTRARLHQRRETSSSWCCHSKSAHIAVCTVAMCATQISPPPLLTQPVSTNEIVLMRPYANSAHRMCVCPAADVPAVIRPITWSGSTSKPSTCCRDPLGSVTANKKF